MGKGQQADCCDGTQKRESGRTYARYVPGYT